MSLTLRRAPVRIVAVIVAALTATASSFAEAQTRGVTIFAAASLAGTLDEIVDAFATSSGVAVTVSYGGTSAIARLIELGAPADIFISADDAWMNYLSERNLIALASRTDLVGNRLVLVAPSGGGNEAITDIVAVIRQTIGPDRLLAMADFNAVPAGRYGKAALEALDIWAEVAPFVAQTNNVRTALAFVARGEAPLGIVYATDAAAEPEVAVVATFDDGLHPPIVYPTAIIAGSDDPVVAGLFAYLTGPDAAAVFSRHGFTALQQPAE